MIPANSSSRDRFATVLLGKSMINQSIIYKWMDEWVDDWHDAPCLSLSLLPLLIHLRLTGVEDKQARSNRAVAILYFFIFLIFLGPELNLAEVGRSVGSCGTRGKSLFLSLLYGMNADGNLTHWLVGLLIDWLSMGVRYGSDVEWRKGK